MPGPTPATMAMSLDAMMGCCGCEVKSVVVEELLVETCNSSLRSSLKHLYLGWRTWKSVCLVTTRSV
jgi:hypothetical protein